MRWLRWTAKNIGILRLPSRGRAAQLNDCTTLNTVVSQVCGHDERKKKKGDEKKRYCSNLKKVAAVREGVEF
jgi:hypothetical protein